MQSSSIVPQFSTMPKVFYALCETFRYRVDSARTIAIQKKKTSKELVVDKLLAHARKLVSEYRFNTKVVSKMKNNKYLILFFFFSLVPIYTKYAHFTVFTQ